jgi:hypothetical protein
MDFGRIWVLVIAKTSPGTKIYILKRCIEHYRMKLSPMLKQRTFDMAIKTGF